MCGHRSFCSVRLVVSSWLDRHFLKCLEPISLQPLPKCSVCVLWHAFNAPAIYNFALTFTSCLCRVSGLARDESRAFGDLSWTCSLPCTYTWPFRYPEIYKSFSEPPMNISFPLFPLKFFGQTLVCLNQCHCLKQQQCSTIATGCFQQTPWE